PPRDGTIFSATQTVTISDTTPGATIYYTLDGTDPAPDNLSSSVYSNSFSVSTSPYVKARAYVGNSQTSDVAAAHLFHSTCRVAWPHGCCQNGQCNTHGFPNCG